MDEKIYMFSETTEHAVTSSHGMSAAHTTTATNIRHRIRDQDLDEAAKLLHDFHDGVTPEQDARVRRKIDWRLMPLMCTVYFIQYLDKTTLGAASILGLLEDNNLSQSQYNWLGTIFYLAYLVFEWPQNLAMQRFPPGKWMAANILVWGIALCAHAGCSNFAGLFVCRMILGACEGSITTGFMIVTGMFYTHTEVTPRIAYWSLFNGFAGIFSGLLSYAVYHMNPNVFSPWKLLMLITGLLTVVVSICFWFLVPDSPAKAQFLSHEERVIAVARLRNQSTGTENKTWKKDQFLEAMKDWKSWAFLIYGAVANVSNSSGNMTALIIESFGFTTSQTTLLGCGNGAVEAVAIIASALLAKRFPNSRAYLGASFAIPNIISGILLVALPWSARGALLFAMYLGFLGGPDFIYAISWCISTTTGHTKKTTTNAMLFIGYCLGNLLSPQMWQSKYAPRYYLPWGIILATYVLRPVQLLVMRYLLQKENRRRDGLGEKEVFCDEQGNEIDQTFSDVSDRRNMAFRYPL